MVKKSEGRKEEPKEEGTEKKDISKTWSDNYTTFSKMWEDSYSKLYKQAVPKPQTIKIFNKFCFSTNTL